MSSCASPYTHAENQPRDYRRPAARERRVAERERLAQEAAESETGANGHGEAKRNRKPWLRWLVSSALIISGLTYYAAGRRERAIVADVETTGALVAPPASWDPVSSPAVLFAFDMPELQLPDMAVEARTYREGGREDALSIGSIADPFYLRVVIDRSQQPRAASFYLDLVRTAAHAGLSVRRSAQASEFATKFGPLELTEATLARNTDARCLAFRGRTLEGKVNLTGWLCGEARFTEPDMLACFLDRLIPTPALRERALETDLRALDKGRTPACETAMNRIAAAE